MSFKIRMQADDFFKAYQVLKEKSNTATHTIMGPSVVCLAFSVELYLKDLHLVSTGKTPRGHNIYTLFEKLLPELKQATYDHPSISQNPFMTKGNIFSPQYFSHTYTRYDRFIDQMKTISNGFEKWRYSYENSVLQYDSFFALALIEAVKSTADSIRFQQLNALKS